MARQPDLETLLTRLAEIRQTPGTDEAVAALRDILMGRHSHAAAVAAEIAGEAQLGALVPDLAASFERLMRNPVKSDPGCRGKTAIVEALHQLDADEAEVFATAVSHVQMEPVYGGRQDTAAGLRGAAARGLVRMNHPLVLLFLAELLADWELPARIAAARAVAYHGGDGGLPLLRLKVLSGDPEPEVLAECFLAMLRIAPEASVEFVERFLDRPEGAVAEAAALSLGESRSPAALLALQRWWERGTDADRGRMALLAAAMHRSDAAIEWLLGLVRNEPGPSARDAIGAFEVYRGEEAMVDRVRRAAAERRDIDLLSAVEQVLG